MLYHFRDETLVLCSLIGIHPQETCADMNAEQSNMTHSIQIEWESIQTKLIERVWDAVFIFGIFGIPTSLIRIFSTGWLNVYAFHLSLATVIFGVTWKRGMISANIKALLALFILSSISLAGFYQFALSSNPAVSLTCTYLLAALLLQRKRAVVFALTITVLVSLIGYGFTTDRLTLRFDVNQYIHNPSSWVFLILGAVLFTLLVAYAIAYYQNAIKSLLVEIAQQRDLIQHQATHDTLTGLPTLRLARDRLEMACSQATRDKNKAAVLFIDLDGFKAANDTFGHEAGDHVLKVVANRLTESIRSIDTAARQGGDEFIVIIHGAESIDGIKTVADKLVKAIAEPIYFNDQLVKIGSSIGIAVYPDHAASAVETLKHADQAMYVVKKSGKNNYSVYAGPVPQAA